MTPVKDSFAKSRYQILRQYNILGVLPRCRGGIHRLGSRVGRYVAKEPHMLRKFSWLVALMLIPVLGEAAVWTSTASMATPRVYHTATLLLSGKVLVVGGHDNSGSYLASAELYAPNGGTWTTTGSMTNARGSHTATLLPSGKVLVTGGSDNNALASAELYDPATETWTPTTPMSNARSNHTATLLPSGKVLVAGGLAPYPLASAELYDPATETWSSAGSLATDRAGHTATLLPNGTVLLAGGVGACVNYMCSYLASAELFDAATATWTVTASMAGPHAFHTATQLPSGMVLIAGGTTSSVGDGATADLYDPATETWTATASMATARGFHTASLMTRSDEVLVAGGESYGLTSTELYDAPTGTWTATAPMGTGRGYHTATLLPNGRLLVAGGMNSGRAIASAELYQ